MLLRVAWLYPVIHKKVASRIIYHIPSILAENTIVHRNLLFHAIQRLNRSAEIILCYETVGKFFLLTVMSIEDIKIGCGKRETVILIPYAQCRGCDLIAIVAKILHIYTFRIEHRCAVICKKSGIVYKFLISGIFQTQKCRSDDRKTILAKYHRILFGMVCKSCQPPSYKKS